VRKSHSASALHNVNHSVLALRFCVCSACGESHSAFSLHEGNLIMRRLCLKESRSVSTQESHSAYALRKGNLICVGSAIENHSESALCKGNYCA
jgi:hypothetical protein